MFSLLFKFIFRFLFDGRRGGGAIGAINDVVSAASKGVRSTLQEARQTQRIMVYHTAKDEKVCKRCNALEGYIFYFNEDGSLKPGDYKKFPPLHARCRCPGRLETRYI